MSSELLLKVASNDRACKNFCATLPLNDRTSLNFCKTVSLNGSGLEIQYNVSFKEQGRPDLQYKVFSSRLFL
jgi:hypothetical protein